MSEKKRKRDSEQDDNPQKKRVAWASDLKISFLSSQDESDLPPAVASTNGFSVPTDISLKAYSRRNELLLHSSSHPRMDYIAGQEASDSLLKHYIAIYDGVSGKLTLTEARKFAMRSALRPKQDEEGEDVDEAAGRESNTAQRNDLQRAFGTRKAKKALASLTENAITPSNGGGRQDAAVSEAIMSKVSSAAMPNREQMEAESNDSKPRPKPNLEAKDAKDVYRLESLVSREILEALPVQDWQDAIKKKENVMTTSRYVSRRLQSVVRHGDLNVLKLLKYMLVLVDFFNSLRPTKHGGKRLPQKDDFEKKLQVNNVVVAGIKRKFTTGSEMSKWHVDNFVTHMAALALTVDNCQTDMYDLQEDLRLEQQQMIAYFRELGCHVTALSEKDRDLLNISKAEAMSHKVGKLRLPLDFPKERKPPRRRR